MTTEDHTRGPVSCEQVGAFVDGELDAEQAEAFRRHLVQCARCQAEMHGQLQLAGLAEEHRHPGPSLSASQSHLVGARSPVALPLKTGRRLPRLQLAGVGGLLAAAVVAAVWLAQRPGAPPDLLARFDGRPTEGWFSAFEGRSYRPYDVSRGVSPRQVGVNLELAAKLSRAGDFRALGTLYALHGEWKRAEEALQKAPIGPDTWNDLGLVKLGEGDDEEALQFLDRAVAGRPGWAPAAFNRGLALSRLELGMAAAEDFNTAAGAGTGPWADEARSRAAFEQRRSEDARTGWRRTAIAQTAQVERGAAWPAELVRLYPDLAWYSLFSAIAVASGPAEVARLETQVRSLDDESGTLTRLLGRLGNRFPRGRAEVAASLRLLILNRTPRLEEKERRALVARVLALGEPDQVVFALNWLDVGGSHAERFREAAGQLGHPFWLVEAERNTAAEELQRGAVLDAERRLRVAFSGCDTRLLPSQCALLGETLAEIYIDLQDLEAARSTIARALDLSRTKSLYSVETKLLELRAEIELRTARFAMANALLRQNSLRAPALCDLTSYLRALSAKTHLARNAKRAAQDDIRAAYACRTTTPDPFRPAALLDLLESRVVQTTDSLDGSHQAEWLLREDLRWIREDADSGPGLRALADALEARLELLGGNLDRALALSRRGLALAGPLHESDRTAAEARSGLRLVAAFALGLSGKVDEALEALASQFEARVPSGCLVGAAQTLDRTLWLARGVSEKPISAVFPYVEGAQTVTPPAVLAALDGCPRVRVLTSASLQSVSSILPPEVAWSYVGPGNGQVMRRAESGLLVTSPSPPSELGLPRLQPVKPPSEGGWTVLSGASATPGRVLAELPRADYIDFQVHGFVDALVPDAARLALSKDVDGAYALSATTVRGLRLDRAPFVTLGACHSAHESVLHPGPWSLPLAFLRAGAAGVLASPAELPDAETPAFFSEVRERISVGADPENALRDARLHWSRDLNRPWVGQVVLFRGG